MGKNNIRKTTEQFITESKKIFGDKYDYSKTEYVNNKTNVCITCPEHGDFLINPQSHLKGSEGCKKCCKDKIGRNIFKTKDDFIEESKKIHGDKYDYSNVEYFGDKVKVCIICPKHGEFWQTPSHHISGEGCPKCKMSFLEKTVKNILDNFNIEYKTEVGSKTLNWIGKLRLDFYIPDLNIGIEVQGQQHYIPVDTFGGIDALQKNIKRDELKKKLCEKNGLKLYYIKYNDNIINETLKILKENGLQI